MGTIKNLGIGALTGLTLGASVAAYSAPPITQKHPCEGLTPTTCAQKYESPQSEYEGTVSRSDRESPSIVSEINAERTPLERIGAIDIEAEYASERIPFGRAISAAAEQTGLNESLGLALVYTESNNRHNASSSAGACGLTQLTEIAWNEVANNSFEKNCEDPKQNLLNGFTYFKKQLDRFGGDVRDAAIAYNAGPSRVGKFLPAETRRFVDKLTTKAEAFESISYIGEFSTMPRSIAEDIAESARNDAGIYSTSTAYTK